MKSASGTGQSEVAAARTRRPSTAELRRPLAVLAIALTVLAPSLAVLIVTWSSNLDTVHVIMGSAVSTVRLGPGPYWIYQDPGSPAFASPADSFTISGPTGHIAVKTVPYHVRPIDVAAPLLGVGLFTEVAGFTIPAAGTYRIAAGHQSGTWRLFVAETLGAAAKRTAPWLAAVLASLITAARSGLTFWRAATGRGRPERLYRPPLGTTSGAGPRSGR